MEIICEDKQIFKQELNVILTEIEGKISESEIAINAYLFNSQNEVENTRKNVKYRKYSSLQIKNF